MLIPPKWNCCLLVILENHFCHPWLIPTSRRAIHFTFSTDMNWNYYIKYVASLYHGRQFVSVEFILHDHKFTICLCVVATTDLVLLLYILSFFTKSKEASAIILILTWHLGFTHFFMCRFYKHSNCSIKLSSLVPQIFAF